MKEIILTIGLTIILLFNCCVNLIIFNMLHSTLNMLYEYEIELDKIKSLLEKQS